MAKLAKIAVASNSQVKSVLLRTIISIDETPEQVCRKTKLISLRSRGWLKNPDWKVFKSASSTLNGSRCYEGWKCRAADIIFGTWQVAG